MIEKTRGAFLLDSGEGVEPGDPLDVFAASPLGTRGAFTPPAAAPWRTCTLAHLSSGGRLWGLVLTYEGQRLFSLQPFLETGEGGWEAWSLAQEKAKVAEHDRIVKGWLGPKPWNFPWGTVTSEYDPRSAAAVLLLRYTAPRR